MTFRKKLEEKTNRVRREMKVFADVHEDYGQSLRRKGEVDGLDWVYGYLETRFPVFFDTEFAE
jgi:hypothetical protein